MKDKLFNVLRKENFEISNEQINKFVHYALLLKEWNKKMNLTANDSDDEIIYKHFLDSLLCLKINLNWHGKVLDVGTGAGFPGIPLKIMKDIELYLLDSLQKRISFLNTVVKELSLNNVFCLHKRAEEMAKDNLYRESFDYVVARAVARLPVLLELCLPFVKIGGYFVALKGPEGLNEIEESKNALDILGGKIINSKEFMLKDINHQRVIITIQKVSTSPKKFPRRPGIPQKRPLG